MIDIKQELEKTLSRIDSLLSNSFSIDSTTRATLLVAKANTLLALQKYE